MNSKPQTTFAHNINPWTGVKTMKNNTGIVPEKLQFTTDPLPQGRSLSAGKYEEFFKTWKIGTAVKCRPEHVSAISHALYSHIKKNKLNAIMRTSRKYPGDKTDTNGRVWLLPKE